MLYQQWIHFSLLFRIHPEPVKRMIASLMTLRVRWSAERKIVRPMIFGNEVERKIFRHMIFINELVGGAEDLQTHDYRLKSKR